jgi:hypothetical protein
MTNKTRKNTLFETALTIFMVIFLAFIFIGNFIYGTNTARILLSIPLAVVAWIILGCGVLAGIDTNQELFEWVWDKAPNGCFSMVAIFLFPIVAIYYIYNKRKNGIIERKFNEEDKE